MVGDIKWGIWPVEMMSELSMRRAVDGLVLGVIVGLIATLSACGSDTGTLVGLVRDEPFGRIGTRIALPLT